MDMKNKVLVSVVSAVGLAALVAGCGTVSGASGSNGSSSSNVITIGTLYASTGSYATSSMPEYAGLTFWANQVNAQGGVTLSNGKKEKVKIVSMDDQSNATTATTEYNQLITQDKVNVLVTDFGSVLTAPAVPIAQEHKVVLFDQSGTGSNFFTPTNKYIVLTSLQESTLWADSLAQDLIKNNTKNIAIVYADNDFDGTQNNTVVSQLAKAGIKPMIDESVPTSTSNYTTIVHNIDQKNPGAIIELGYQPNDTAFLQAYKASGVKVPIVFTIFPGQLPAIFESQFGASGLAGVSTYPTPPFINVQNVNYGMNLTQFESAFKSAESSLPGHPTGPINFLDVAGYNTGLIIQHTLESAKSLSQSNLRAAVDTFSGKITTLDGNFQINSEGAQVGEALPTGHFVYQNGKLSMVVDAN